MRLPEPAKPQCEDEAWLGHKSDAWIADFYRTNTYIFKAGNIHDEDDVRGANIKHQYARFVASQEQARRILDVGSSCGGLIRGLAHLEHVEKIVGLEPNEYSHWVATEARKDHPHKEKLQYLNVGYEDFETIDGFDLVICFDLLEHFRPQKGVELIEFLIASTAPGGVGILATPDKHGRYGISDTNASHITFWTGKEIDAVFQELAGIQFVYPVWRERHLVNGMWRRAPDEAF